ncbi:class I SAM-dependent RNA methyltransferase [Chelativorans sp. AA-79]|uniref:class I SAM-dependent RNA methyltransferase n=1 Tax=Chelativorans sp. AA-79 TaxID=3028735 RepID=UPI0023F71753|nr:class I SAM-dependent RNA methyltransferase [Chelativorans sp. AA-79]WEX07834.1 class I SAM-dependent RNA methyltransferase [Chelativorans sp. AA-79]
MSVRLTIDALGAQGDGVAHTPEGPVYVPFALPGEEVLAHVEKQRGTLLAVEKPSPVRVDPASPHFGVCGGCSVQHMAPAAYAEWKREKVVRALRTRGLPENVESLVLCPPASRRRVTFTARAAGGRALLGFNAAQSHRIVEIESCPVAAPQIVAALPDLRALAALIAMGPKPFHVTVTATRTGLDIATEGAAERLGERKRRQAVDLVLARGFARLSVGGEVLVERERPVVLFGDVPVAVPAGGFLQAAEQAEQAMAGLVTAHLKGAKHVADLFAGSGTFALRLARESRVHAAEGDAAALAALEEAAKRAIGLKPVSVEKRDLFNRPLSAKDLDRFDGLVFDPPRAGAEAQCRQIARSTVARVAAVSCNPGTLARDLAILVEGGYGVVSITPIDQFLWSPHVEVVALLERGKQRG